MRPKRLNVHAHGEPNSGSLFAWALIVLVVLPLTLAACGKTIDDTIDDTTITARVKTALLNDPQVGGMKIDVDTTRGVVMLSGSVKSEAEATRAIQLAKQATGVKDVKSTLQVQP
jgi:osmotically-inducible protein OsmY